MRNSNCFEVVLSILKNWTVSKFVYYELYFPLSIKSEMFENNSGYRKTCWRFNVSPLAVFVWPWNRITIKSKIIFFYLQAIRKQTNFIILRVLEGVEMETKLNMTLKDTPTICKKRPKLMFLLYVDYFDTWTKWVGHFFKNGRSAFELRLFDKFLHDSYPWRHQNKL